MQNMTNISAMNTGKALFASHTEYCKRPRERGLGPSFTPIYGHVSPFVQHLHLGLQEVGLQKVIEFEYVAVRAPCLRIVKLSSL